MARIKKGHHHIPRTYLENFADASGQIFVLKEDGTIFPTKPENIFKEAYFYNVTLESGEGSLIVEDTLADIEGKFASIYREKIAQDKELTAQERAEMAIFLAALYIRTKSHREGLRGAFTSLRDQMKEWGDMFRENEAARDFSARMDPGGGDRISMEDVNETVDNIDEFHSKALLNQLPGIGQMLFDMKWMTLSAPPGEQFITSDSPVQVLRPESIKKYGAKAIGAAPGLVYKDTEVTIPISSEKALVMGWKLAEDIAMETDLRSLNQINWRSGMHAKELVARDRMKLEEILAKIEAQEGRAS